MTQQLGSAVDPAQTLDDGEWQRTSPLALGLAALHGLKNAIIPLVAIVFGSGILDEGLAIIGALFLGVVGLQIFAAWLSWRRLCYRVGASDIRVEKGFISRSARSVPYERIQDVSLEQGPLARLLGLVEVQFETGAGGKDELKLSFVTIQEGERLREVVRDSREAEAAALPRAASAGQADISAAPEPEGTLLFAMGPGRLLIFGLFQFSLVVFAVLAGAAQQLDFLLPFDLWDLDGWTARLAGPGDWLVHLGWAARFVGVAIGVFALFFVGLLTGIGRTFLRDWGFRLDRTAKGFRRRRGLLTRTDVVMPVHRVQSITVTTGLLRRIWGWHGLAFISLAQDAKSANHEVAPFARMDEIAPIVEAAQFSLPGDAVDWHRPARNWWVDNAIMGAAPAFIAGLVATVLLPLPVALFLFACTAFIAVRQYYQWRVERHAVDGAQILASRGWLSPSLQLANKLKLHSVEISQGPVSRRRGYANVQFGLAGGTLAFHGVPLEQARAMRSAVLDSIAAVDFSRLAR